MPENEEPPAKREGFFFAMKALKQNIIKKGKGSIFIN